MQIPETPKNTQELELLKRLKAYAEGRASWLGDENPIGQNTKAECQTLYTNIVAFVKKMLMPLLDRINAREMETFTMHDSNHSMKVAHLMWHIINHDRRDTLTPPEIGILVISAFLHDLGMALSKEEREKRLEVNSDLWGRLEIDEQLKNNITNLKEQLSDKDISEPIKDRTRRKLCQAEEILLCQDTRERHACSERYEELLNTLQEFHKNDPTKLPDVESCLSYAGDSFREKLIEICVSHNQDLSFILDNDETHIERPRFPNNYTLGSCTADLHMSAAALRLADILDFDRERTPNVLFHYLLPTNLAPEDDKSVLEWSKHLTISNWHIETEAIFFRGHCTSHIIHHAVVQFCDYIENEIKSTLDTFSIRKTNSPFILPTSVQTYIEEHGYTYVPYKFELDDRRVYGLLMGGAIYDNPLVAIRELVQNAVDACKLRDALDCLYNPNSIPNTTERIKIRYEEPTGRCLEPKLTVRDSGTGMDQWILEKYFLKVGKSYYRSSDFNKIRYQLQTKSKELDFAPVSEFGIGFLSCFLVADRLKVITAMWEAIHGDTIKRTLIIDGPTRLIQQSEKRNEGLDRFKGTSVTLFLLSGSKKDRNQSPKWYEIKDYLTDICQDLPYRLNLENVSSDGCVNRDQIDPIPLVIEISPQFEPFTIHIPINDEESGLEGEIMLINPFCAERLESEIARGSPISDSQEIKKRGNISALLRGGFKIGDVTGLPRSWVSGINSRARLRFNWNSQSDRKYPLPNISRNKTANNQLLSDNIFRLWLDYLLQHVDNLPEGLLYRLNIEGYIRPMPLIWRSNNEIRNCNWLESYDAITIYKLGKRGWCDNLGDEGQRKIQNWENSKGDSLKLYSDWGSLFFNLLLTVLPKITSFEMVTDIPSAICVKTPQPGWRAVLEGWDKYITSYVEFGPFVEYTGKSSSALFYEPSHSYLLNSRYEDKLLNMFQKEEAIHLAKLFYELISSRQVDRQAVLTNTEIELFERAAQSMGDLEISSATESWRIDSFKTSNISKK